MSTIVKARFEWGTSTEERLAACNLEAGGKVQQVIDDAVIRLDMKYVPWQTGILAESPNTASTPGQVVYEGPYARYLYYGEVWGPNFFIPGTGWRTYKDGRKHPTGRSLEYSKEINTLAGSFWFERMKADHTQDILEEAQNAVGK